MEFSYHITLISMLLFVLSVSLISVVLFWRPVTWSQGGNDTAIKLQLIGAYRNFNYHRCIRCFSWWWILKVTDMHCSFSLSILGQRRTKPSVTHRGGAALLPHSTPNFFYFLFFTVHLFDPHVTRLYQPGVPAFQNGHSAGLKASLMIPGPLTLPLTRLLWKMS